MVASGYTLEFGWTGAGGLATQHLAFAFCQGKYSILYLGISRKYDRWTRGLGASILIPAKLASARAKAVVILG
jgi:hypothetical protein